MNLSNLKKGAGQTEYIILIVLVAISVLFSVSKYGKEVRRLFTKSTSKLSLMDNKSDYENSDEGGIGWDSDEEQVDENLEQGQLDLSESETEESAPKKSEEECRQEFNKLMSQKLREQRQYQRTIKRLTYLEKLYRTKASFYFRHASGWWNFWGHSTLNRNYIEKGKMYLRLAENTAAKIENITGRHNAFLEDWNEKMEQWQSECGSNP